MSKVIQCDGCDRDLTKTDLKLSTRFEVRAMILRSDRGDPLEMALDLCPSCYSQFNRYVDPRQWVRHREIA